MLCAEGVIENKKYISLSDHYVVGDPSYYDMSGKQVIVLSPADLSLW